MGAKFWESDKFRLHLAMKIHDLEDSTYKLALVTSAATSSEDEWATSTDYEVGDVVVPTTRNGHRYICTTAGTSVSEPAWPTTEGASIGSSPEWTEYGGDMCAHDLWADFSGSEAATGDGYTTGGETLASKTLPQTYRDVYWDAADVTWTGLTKTFRFAVLYLSGTVDGIVNPVVGYALCDDTFVDKSISGINYKLYWSTSGILQIGRA
jgi:hypothetical protein